MEHHQIPALADAGRTRVGSPISAIVSPIEAIEATIHRLTADLVGLLDDVGAERAACWLATGVPWWWNAPLRRTTELAVAALSVPALKHRCRRTQRSAAGLGRTSSSLFQEPGIADAELDGGLARTMRRMAQPSGRSERGTRMLAPGPDGFIDRCSGAGRVAGLDY